MTKQINTGDKINGVMIGEGWSPAERATRVAGATVEDVRVELERALADRADCARYGDDTSESDARIAELRRVLA